MSIGGGADSPPTLQFLCLDSGDEYGVLEKEDVTLLLSIQQLHTPYKQQKLLTKFQPKDNNQIEFGCASEVFNSITSGHFQLQSETCEVGGIADDSLEEKASSLKESVSRNPVKDYFPNTPQEISQLIENVNIDFEQEVDICDNEGQLKLQQFDEFAASTPATSTSHLVHCLDTSNQANKVYQTQLQDSSYATHSQKKFTQSSNDIEKHQKVELRNHQEQYGSEQKCPITPPSFSTASPQAPSTDLYSQTKQLSDLRTSYSGTPSHTMQPADLYHQSVSQASPIPGTAPHAGAQHIHINHYTANLTYLPVVSSANTVQPIISGNPNPGLATRQPVPFATYPLNYVAPFPQSTSTPPIFTSTPFPPPMVIYPPGHTVQFSMYPPPPTVTGIDSSENKSGQESDIMNNCDVVRGTLIPEHSEDKSENICNKLELREGTKSAVHDRFESRTKESQANGENIEQISSRDHQIKIQEEQELVNFYEKGKDLNMTNSLTTSTTSSCSSTIRHLDEKVFHQPTPPPFPLPPDSGDSDIENGKNKSWASVLFSGSDPNVERINVDKPTARIPPFSSTQERSKPAPAVSQTVTCTQEQLQLGEFLKNYELDHSAASILPRGLTNRSNWCFVNAILQSLLACPSFFNLFKNLPNNISQSRAKSSTPMLDAVVQFVYEFKPLEVFGKHQKKDKTRKRDNLMVDNSFEPKYVYNVLMQSQSMDEGKQEDAEEFLSHLLNVLDEEMRGLIKLGQAKHIEDEADISDSERQHSQANSCAISTRTPIQSLFAGLTRSSVIAENCETSATLQPFFSLQLDIQTHNVQNIQQVLEHNFAVEKLDEYRNPRSGQLGDASKTLSVEELPPIMILHLKRMVHDGYTEQKVMKKIDFPVDLFIDKEMLSANCKTKYSLKQRSYKLFAVVYHNGKEAIKGHYISDIYHTGYSCWLRCNDSSVSMISEEEVTTPLHNSTPYILFYRQKETMGGGGDRFKNPPPKV